MTDDANEDGRNTMFGQFSWVVAGRIAAALLQALSFILLARAVAPAEFGLFSAVWGVATLAQTLVDLGISTLVLRERAIDPANGLITACLRLNDRLSVILSFASVSILVSLALWFNPVFWQLVPLGVWVASERNADTWLGIALADGDAHLNTMNLVGRRLLTVGLFEVAYTLAVAPLLAYSIACAVAAAASSGIVHGLITRRLPPMVRTSVKRIAVLAWPFWLNSAATQARNLDVVLVAAFAGGAQAGFYASAARVTGPLRIVPTSLAAVLLPQASRRTSQTIKGLLKTVSVVTAGMGLFYVLIAVASPFAIPLLLGESYRSAIGPIQITASGLTFAAAASLLGALLQGVGLKIFVAHSSLAMTIVCLVGCAVGAALWGARGAAFGLSFAFVIQAALLAVRLGIFIKRKEANR